MDGPFKEVLRVLGQDSHPEFKDAVLRSFYLQHQQTEAGKEG
jgi:hypothetical protein